MCEEMRVRFGERQGKLASSRLRLCRRQALQAGLLLAASPLLSPRSAFAEETSALSPAEQHARWLAGVAPLPGVEPSSDWRAYAQTENERWQLTQSRLKAMQDWSARELQPLLPTTGYDVFYPFAGPDALHAIALFGTARRLVLVGLEPVGTLPDPTKPLPAGLFSRLGAALADVHRLTFFRTREMSTDFQREGVLSALVATIVRMGGKIVSVQSANGASAPMPTPSRNARIDWTTSGGQTRRLDYIQADLANAGLKADPQLMTNLHMLAPHVTFVKAAMYLLAEPRFSTLRQAMIDDSAVLLQDDTGIPFRYFDERWAMRFFGKYETPGAPFEERAQSNLRAAYEQRPVSALPFGIGYHVQPTRSNLLIASKGVLPTTTEKAR